MGHRSLKYGNEVLPNYPEEDLVFFGGPWPMSSKMVEFPHAEFNYREDDIEQGNYHCSALVGLQSTDYSIS